MSTLGRPVSQVMVRSASLSASRWVLSMSTSSSRAESCESGFFRSCDRLVVKPFTSSPAMPMMTWLDLKPAISSASWRATWQLSTTALMSATVPDCMCERPWRFRPTPCTVAVPSGLISNTSAFANSVPTSSAVHAASLVVSPPFRKRRQKATRLLPVAQRRFECLADRGQGARQSITARAAGLRHLRAAAALAVDQRRTVADERAGADAARHQVVAHRDEELRLIRLQPERDHARAELGAQRLGVRLQILHRFELRGIREKARPVDV